MRVIKASILVCFLLTLPRAQEPPLGVLASNIILDVVTEADTVWAITPKGINKIWIEGEDFVTMGYNEAHGLGEGFPYHVISKYGKTFVSTYKASGEAFEGTGISALNNGIWETANFSWKNDNSVSKLGISADAFDSLFYFAYGGGSLLMKDAGVDAAWKIIVPDTTGTLPRDYPFSTFPPASIQEIVSINGNDTARTTPMEFLVWSIVIDSISPDSCHLYLGTSNGLKASHDKGATWRRVATPAANGNFVEMLWRQVSSTGFVLWASVTGNGDDNDPGQVPAVIKSSDAGVTWSQVSRFGTVAPNGIDFTGDTIWAATRNGLIKMVEDEVIQSDDVFRENGLSAQEALCIDASFTSDSLSRLWVGTSDGLYYSATSGQSWKKLALRPPISTGLRTVYAVPSVLSASVSSLRIAYSLSSDATVTITVHDWDMNLVRTIVSGEPRKAGASTPTGHSEEELVDTWDGRNDRGKKVPVGTYYFKVKASNGEKGFGKIIVLR